MERRSPVSCDLEDEIDRFVSPYLELYSDTQGLNTGQIPLTLAGLPETQTEDGEKVETVTGSGADRKLAVDGEKVERVTTRGPGEMLTVDGE